MRKGQGPGGNLQSQQQLVEVSKVSKTPCLLSCFPFRFNDLKGAEQGKGLWRRVGPERTDRMLPELSRAEKPKAQKIEVYLHSKTYGEKNTSRPHLQADLSNPERSAP